MLKHQQHDSRNTTRQKLKILIGIIGQTERVIGLWLFAQNAILPPLHPMVINNNGPRWNASHRPNGVEIEFLQQQYTSPPFAKKRRKCFRPGTVRKLGTNYR
jgi:hypothetical protein